MAEPVESAHKTPRQLRQINLQKGWPNASLIPSEQIRAATQIALTDPSIWENGLNYGCEPMAGYQPLREEIAKWLSDFYECATLESITELNSATSTKSRETVPDANRICITGGASQNLACALQVFTDPFITTVWMVAPCYFLACNIFKDAGLRLRAVPEVNDETCHGIDLDWLEIGLKECERKGEDVKPLKYAKPWGQYYKNIIYCVPTFSNPSGKTMSLATRHSLVRLARKYDALIITDDVYDHLQWSTMAKGSVDHSRAPIARLVDIDRTMEPVPSPDSFGNAMSNGSFSKIVAPGIRTGWAEATPKFIRGLSKCGSTASGGAPSHMTSTFVAQMLKDRTLQNYISDVLCPSYRRRYLTLLEAIRRCLVPLGVRLGETDFGDQKLFGGYFIWLKLPRGVDCDILLCKAKASCNLVLSPGSEFEVSGDNDHEKVQFRNEIRLSFAWATEDDLLEGVQRLKDVLQSEIEAGKNVDL